MLIITLRVNLLLFLADVGVSGPAIGGPVTSALEMGGLFLFLEQGKGE